jgi:FMN phosphatase YigB (HAD superfamily)
MSAYLIDYPFAGRLFPFALKVLKRLNDFGSTVILSDGDVVFQPHKVERAGLSDAVDGRVLIYIHKEEALDDVERRFPAEHYVLVDDKLRILAAVKRFWSDRVTTVFARQGSYARDPQTVGAFPAADVTIERIGDLLSRDLPQLRPAMSIAASKLEPAR